MEQVLARLNTRVLFQDKPPREERAVRLKRDDAKNLAAPEVGIGGDGLLLHKGLVSGVQLEASDAAAEAEAPVAAEVPLVGEEGEESGEEPSEG